jgi:hypothetical protein
MASVAESGFAFQIDDNEDPMANNEGIIDPERIIYNLQDLKALKKQLFFV